MKFPVATTALVSAALVFVVWQQVREESGQPDAGSFQNMSSKPVERGEVVDWVASQVPALCTEATGSGPGSQEHDTCLETSRSSEPGCRRLAVEEYPSTLTSDAAFRDLSTTMMACMVRQGRPLNG